MNGQRLEFGIYPLGVAGTPQGLAVGPPDDYDRVRAVVNDLGANVVPRTYLVDMDPGGEDSVLALAERYSNAGLLGHVTLGCLRDTFDVTRWARLVRTVISRYGDQLHSLQVTNEPNLSFMDGSKPYVLEALVTGVVAAKDEARRHALQLEIGFGSVPQSPVALPTFWADLSAAGGSTFTDAVDFVGHNFYVDVFEDPVDLAAVPGRVEQVLRGLRDRDLPLAGIPDSVPIRVAENGWPTGTNRLTGAVRTYEYQPQVIETIIRTVHQLAGELNISHYILFGLRDADSSEPDLFHQFGILRSDYTPKPAYSTFQSLIRELAG